MKTKIIHKRKGCWCWPSKPLCNVSGDHWKMRCVKNWDQVTCKRCLRARPERLHPARILKYYGPGQTLSTR